MQGRLIGKRFQAEFFLDGAIDETHGCDYLLADDIDMEPVPGYEAANWAKGYGDFVMKPDIGDADEVRLARGHGARASPISSTTITTSRSRTRRAPSSRRSSRGSRSSGSPPTSPPSSNSTSSTRTSAPIHDKGYRDLKTAGYYIEDYHIFQTTKEEGGDARDAQAAAGLGHSGRELQGRVGPGPGRDQRPIRRGARPWPTATS